MREKSCRTNSEIDQDDFDGKSAAAISFARRQNSPAVREIPPWHAVRKILFRLLVSKDGSDAPGPLERLEKLQARVLAHYGQKKSSPPKRP